MEIAPQCDNEVPVLRSSDARGFTTTVGPRPPMTEPKSPPEDGLAKESFIPSEATFDIAEAPSAIRPVALQVIDGRYRVVGQVGSGAMGFVLRGEDLFLQRPVAIKMVAPSVDPAVSERFVKEARALAQLRHENIVQIYAFGPYERSSYLAMELVDGQSLESIIDSHLNQGTTIPLPRAIAILKATARGLDAVHAQKLIHRDVKPANIIIEKDSDRPVLIDFGLARRRSNSSPRMSIVGGTPSYMAPEQAKDPDGTRVTSRTDVYAFACTAFETLTNHAVFEGNDVFTVLIAHLNEAPRPISSLRPELAPFDAVIQRGLAKAPLDRYGSAGEMMADLEARVPHIGRPDVPTRHSAPYRPQPDAPHSVPLGPPRSAFDTQWGPASTHGGAAPPPPASRAAALKTLPEMAALPGVVVLASDNGLRRTLTRIVTATLRTHGFEVVCDAAETATEAFDRVGRGTYQVVVIDEESCAGRLAELVGLVRKRRPNADVVVVSRDIPATMQRLGEARVRHLVPKPMNVHVLSAVIGRLDLIKAGAKP